MVPFAKVPFWYMFVGHSHVGVSFVGKPLVAWVLGVRGKEKTTTSCVFVCVCLFWGPYFHTGKKARDMHKKTPAWMPTPSYTLVVTPNNSRVCGKSYAQIRLHGELALTYRRTLMETPYPQAWPSCCLRFLGRFQAKLGQMAVAAGAQGGRLPVLLESGEWG